METIEYSIINSDVFAELINYLRVHPMDEYNYSFRFNCNHKFYLQFLDYVEETETITEIAEFDEYKYKNSFGFEDYTLNFIVGRLLEEKHRARCEVSDIDGNYVVTVRDLY